MLQHPTDLQAWLRWQKSRNRLRQIRHLLEPENRSQELFLYQKSSRVRVLFAVDANSPTAVAAVLKPLEHLGHDEWAVVSSVEISKTSKFLTQLRAKKIPQNVSQMYEEFQDLRVVYSVGHYLPAGFFASKVAESRSIKNVVAQHGLLTPFAPPLPANSLALAFTAADGNFWTAGRQDVQVIAVGSQLLWEASQVSARNQITDKPIFLGQLHGAELPRRISARSAEKFCSTFDASYRKHPYETDVLSRMQHNRWKAQGIDFVTTTQSLATIGRPVVSIFSTGVLEAAAAGIPSWVYCEKAPDWLFEFWDRYQMNIWGNPPTQAPRLPDFMPALQTAKILNELLGERK